jgi:hypothetical protein
MDNTPKEIEIEADMDGPRKEAELFQAKKQLLMQQLQQVNKQIKELRGQEDDIKNMIISANNEGQRIVGALNLIEELTPE